jgi:hypothetical protein
MAARESVDFERRVQRLVALCRPAIAVGLTVLGGRERDDADEPA